MDFQILISNLTNPTLLFFILGIIASTLKSDLEIPPTTSKFISLYLLFSIGFRGGQELAHESFSIEIGLSILLGLTLASLVPLYTFFILRRKLNIFDAGAIAAAYGSVSAVTFVAASNFLESQQTPFDGHMVAVMALMESPAIIVGIFLINQFGEQERERYQLRKIFHHALTNGSVLMVTGSLIIGLIADVKQAEGIRPFTTDIFKGFLAIFLLEMGMITAKRFAAFRTQGWFVSLFALLIPAINGCLAVVLSSFITSNDGNQFLFGVLAASASYIAVPASMRLVAPQADPGLYIPMALGVTFPFNITVGMPLYYSLVKML
jgi:hypothetical protein